MASLGSYSQTVEGVVTNVTCNGMSNGSIDLTITDGSGSYTFEWESSNGYTNSTEAEDIFDLEAGSYTVTVEDAAKGLNSINTVANFTVLEPSPIVISIDTQSDPLCNGDANGLINISVSGGTPGYGYTWSAMTNTSFSAYTEDINNLAADEYIVHLTDDNDCEMSSSPIVLNNPGLLEVQLDPTDVSCYGADNGSIDLTIISGGTAPFTYLWSNGATSEDISGLTVSDGGYGEYSVTITDVNACETENSSMINGPMEAYINIVVTNSTCGNSDGSARVETESQTPTALWSTGETEIEIYNLAAGIYSVEVSDEASTCSEIRYFIVEDNSSATITPTVINSSSLTSNDGQISLSISGGTAPHIALWDNAMVGNLNPNLYTGSYSATITDADGCISTTCVYVGSNLPLNASISGNNASTCSAANGSATVYPWGGISPYAYAWDDPNTQTTETASNLTAGIYHCVVTDVALNQITLTVAVGDDGAPNVYYLNEQTSDCGLSNGSIEVSVTGGTAPYSFLWSNGATDQNLSNIPAGSYSLLVTDNAFPTACHTAYNTSISSNIPATQSICMVTVDSATNHNLVIWENAQENGIDHYNIYRQSCDYNFRLIGSVDANAISVFEDTTSLPFVRSYAYKISAVNACGDESQLSTMHKTIHLGINLDETAGEAQLLWDDYMGFPNPIFNIYKKTVDLDWSLYQQVTGDNYSFTDYNYNDTTISYAILVEHPGGGCDAWNGNTRASGGPYYQSSSNLEDEGIVNHTNLTKINNQVSIYPNPTSKFLNIESKELIKSIRLFDISGRLLLENHSLSQNKYIIDSRKFRSGVYILEVESSELIQERIVIE